MARVTFTSNLQRHVSCPVQEGFRRRASATDRVRALRRVMIAAREYGADARVVAECFKR